MFYLNTKHDRLHILEVETFENTFGPKSQRKRPNLVTCDLAEFAEKANERCEKYDEAKDLDIVRDNEGITNEAMFPLFKAGQSKRIWKELYKVWLGLDLRS
jgi:nuclear GTP-binding protein